MRLKKIEFEGEGGKFYREREDFLVLIFSF